MTEKNVILFLSADPTDQSRLRLSQEQREIQQKIRLAKYRDNFNFESRTSVRTEDISQALLDLQPNLVHFSGHGASSGALCFENKFGQSQLVDPEALADLFSQFRDHIRCVILSACYSEKQAKGIASHIDYVIGMNERISDEAAIAFAIGFYQALGADKSIESAYKLGLSQIRLQGFSEHFIPVLLTNENKAILHNIEENEALIQKAEFVLDEHINDLIARVNIGDWNAAFAPAIAIVSNTDNKGKNNLFEQLLDYQDYEGNDDTMWSAILVIETCAQLSPSLINHEILARMAKSKNFEIRGMAASICMDFAQYAPDRVPIDILLNLSRYDENWYVQAPANAALKAIASSQPVVLEIYYQRLLSNVQGERAHAAYSLAGIAQKEAWLLDVEKLKSAQIRCEKMGDQESCEHLDTALSKTKETKKPKGGYKYGL